METTVTDQFTTQQLEQMLAESRKKDNAEATAKRTNYEAIKEQLIIDGCHAAMSMSFHLAHFKKQMFQDCEALYAMLQEYSNRHADGDGNFKIISKDGTFKVEYCRQKLGHFDERSVQGSKHIIDFINRHFSGDPITQKLIKKLLERTNDMLDIKLVQQLYAMENDYDDVNWKEGIRLIKESWVPTESKDYIRFYQKVNSVWQLINLNFSSVRI